MRGVRGAAALALGLALAAGCGDGRDAGAPGPPAPKPVPAESAKAKAEDSTPSRFDDCPGGTGPRELSVPATDTVLRWCEREGLGGARIQHGRWEKLQDGRVVERGSFDEGVRDGLWTIFWSNGGRQSQGEYRDGRRAGIWTFWRADGSEIQRIDYEELGSEAIDIAEEPGAPPPLDAPLVTLRFENGSETDLVFALEPSTEAYSMPPGASFEVRTRRPGDAEIVVESTDSGLIVRPGRDAQTNLFVDGVEVDLRP